MSDWIRLQQSLPAGSTDLGPLQLAWLGDAVWELHQRLRHCRQAGRSKDLHRAVVSEVRADAQAVALKRLEPWLTEEEKDLVRRGRIRAVPRRPCRSFTLASSHGIMKCSHKELPC